MVSWGAFRARQGCPSERGRQPGTNRTSPTRELLFTFHAKPLSSSCSHPSSLTHARGPALQLMPYERRAHASASLTARGLAALEIVEIHVHLPGNFDRRARVAAAKATADGVGDDPKALAELVDEAE